MTIFHCRLKICFLLSFGVWILGVQSYNLILTLSGYLLRQAPIVLERSLHTSGIVADYSLKVMCLSWSVCCHASVNTRVQRVSSCFFVHMLIGAGGSHTCEGNDKSAWKAKQFFFFEDSSDSAYNFKQCFACMCIQYEAIRRGLPCQYKQVRILQRGIQWSFIA